MPNVYTIDFGDGTVAQGGGFSDHFPPGQYLMQIDKLEQKKTKSGDKDMVELRISVTGGSQKGKRLIDRFLIPRANTDDSRLGVQRFNSVLVATLGKAASGKQKLDFDKLVNKKMLVEVNDREESASDDGKYKARTVSVPTSYHRAEASASAAQVEAPAPATNGAQAEMEDQGALDEEPAATVSATEEETADSLDDLYE